MKKHVTWSRLPVVTRLGVVVLFVGLCGAGWYAGAQFTPQGEENAAAAWKWKKHTLPLAPSAEATTSPATRKSVQTAQKEKKNTAPKPVATSTAAPTPKPTTPAPTTTQPQWPAETQPTPTPTPTTPPATTPASGETRFTAYITAYTYWDNTPPGSAAISHPIIHQKAGGTGTYSDPITLAVGHSYAGGTHVLDYPAGTKFYLPYLRKYFIVEDTCGDGPTPEKGPCHTGYQGNPWLDLWIDGANGSRSATDRCASDLTELHTVIQNPAANYAVVAGPVYNNGCAQQFGDTPVVAI